MKGQQFHLQDFELRQVDLLSKDFKLRMGNSKYSFPLSILPLIQISQSLILGFKSNFVALHSLPVLFPLPKVYFPNL